MGLIDDFYNKTIHPEKKEDDDYTEITIEIEAILTDDQYNELQYELHELLTRYKVFYKGI